MSVALLGALLGVVAFLKSGIEIPGLVTVWDLETWPQPVDVYPHMSYGLRFVGWLLRADSWASYAAISAGAIVLALVVSIWALRRSSTPVDAKFVVIAVLGGPIAWGLFSTFGRPDPLTIAGGIVVGALGTRWYWAVAGALLAVAGNADQAVVLTLSLLVVALSRPMRPWRLPAACALAVAASASALLTIWAESAGVPSRGGLLGVFWKQSLQQFFAALPLQLYAGYGLALVVILWALMDGRARSAAPVMLGALAIPLTMTAFTLDQTRVLVGCSSASVVAVAVKWGPDMWSYLATRLRYPLATLLLIVVALPAVEIAGDLVRVPWLSYVAPVQAFIIEGLTG